MTKRDEEATAVEPSAATTSDVLVAIAGMATYEIPMDDATKAARDIMERVLRASSPEEISAAGAGDEVWHARELVGVPLVIRSAKFMPSAFTDEPGGPTVFAVIEAAAAVDIDANMPAGSAMVVTTGARTVLVQLLKLQQLDALPTSVPWRFVEAGQPTRSGYTPMWLEQSSAKADAEA